MDDKQKTIAILLGIAMVMSMHKSDLENIKDMDDKLAVAKKITETFETALMATGYELVPLDRD